MFQNASIILVIFTLVLLPILSEQVVADELPPAPITLSDLEGKRVSVWFGHPAWHAALRDHAQIQWSDGVDSAKNCTDQHIDCVLNTTLTTRWSDQREIKTTLREIRALCEEVGLWTWSELPSVMMVRKVRSIGPWVLELRFEVLDSSGMTTVSVWLIPTRKGWRRLLVAQIESDESSSSHDPCWNTRDSFETKCTIRRSNRARPWPTLARRCVEVSSSYCESCDAEGNCRSVSGSTETTYHRWTQCFQFDDKYFEVPCGKEHGEK